MFNKKDTIIFISSVLVIVLAVSLSVLFFFKNNIDKKVSNNTEILQENSAPKTNKNIFTEKKENYEFFDSAFEENFKNITEQTVGQEIKIDEDLYQILDLIGYSDDEMKKKIKLFEDNGMDFGMNKKLMSEVIAKFGDKIDTETLGRIKKNHLIFLCFTNELHKNYLGRNDISFEEYKDSISLLFVLEQKIYKENLTNEEYEDFFDMTKEETEGVIMGFTEIAPEFEYYNSDATMEEIYEKVPRWKLDRIVELSKAQSLAELETGELVNMGELTVDEAIEYIEVSFKIYLEGAREILDEEEFHLMFASVEKQF
ncbi:hypothetical protein KAI52_01265 [Candidatus Parcubacteria bacterium]|nr:hypothetical protein [Candidatus Parcubacteria bacterium]